MTWFIYISPKAIEDIQNASNWYNQKQNTLGTRFKNQVKTQINLLSNSPKTFSIKYKNIRCATVPKFPFLIHYRVNEKTKIIDIVSVFHTSQNPFIWNLRH